MLYVVDWLCSRCIVYMFSSLCQRVLCILGLITQHRLREFSVWMCSIGQCQRSDYLRGWPATWAQERDALDLRRGRQGRCWWHCSQSPAPSEWQASSSRDTGRCWDWRRPCLACWLPVHGSCPSARSLSACYKSHRIAAHTTAHLECYTGSLSPARHKFKHRSLLNAAVARGCSKNWCTLWVKKQGTTILSITSPNVDRFSTFFTDRFISKYATKSLLTIPAHLKGVAKLPCETSVSEIAKIWCMHRYQQQWQGSVATCLRCGGLFSDHFSTNLLLSLLVK